MTVIATRALGPAVIRVVQGDLTLAETEAIVNAANSLLQHGGGVAGAISSRGGPTIQEESDAAGYTPTGQVAVTSGGNLKARYVVHAVGPRGGDPGADGLLAEAVLNSLRAAESLGLASISFPAISSGIFGFPKDRCAQILVATTARYLRDHPEAPLRQVDFVLLGGELLDLFQEALQREP